MLFYESKRPPPIGQSGYIWELKFDGYRLIAGVQDDKVQLMTRGGSDATAWFPEVAAGLAQLPGGQYILDGEVCVLDDIGRSDFNRLQDRAKRRRWVKGGDAVVFRAFDLLARDGWPLTSLAVESRKHLLKELLTPCPPSVLYVGHFDAEHGADLFAQAKALEIEDW